MRKIITACTINETCFASSMGYSAANVSVKPQNTPSQFFLIKKSWPSHKCM